MNWKQILVLVLGVLLLAGGLPAIWKFAKGAARLLLSVLLFAAIIALCLWAITSLAAVV